MAYVVLVVLLLKDFLAYRGALARGATNGVGAQLSFRKAAMDGVVSRDSSPASLISPLSNGAGSLLMPPGISPTRAIRAISTRIMCLMSPALSIRYP
jgi:hypothetical protein